MDLANKSEEFLAARDDSVYKSNVVNQYLDEVSEPPRLLPE